MESLGLCLNLKNNALTQWGDLECSGLADVDGRLCLVNSSGIAAYGADTDDGTKISAHLKTHTTNMGALQLKRPRRMVLTGVVPGRLKVDLELDERAASTYVLQSSGQTQKNHVLNLSSARQGAFLGVKVSNVNGSDFSLDTGTLMLQVLDRTR